MTRYASVFWYGSTEVVCSLHKTFYAADRAAKKCEKRGGIFHHAIWEINSYKRKRVSK
jgi:hypothetical protein